MDLTPDLQTILIQIVNFLVLGVMLYYLAFRPIMRSMEKRAAERKRLEQQLGEERVELAQSREALEARLVHAEEEADTIVTAAQEKATDTRATMVQSAREESERILAEAHAEAQRLRSQATVASQSQTIESILEISAQLIGRVAPPEAHDRLVQQLSDRIWEMGRSEMGRVEDFRRSLGDRTPTAHVVTARPLSPEQQGLLARTFTALADRHVDLEVQDDSSLASGMRVRLADIVVDSSIAGQLELLRDDTLAALQEAEQVLRQLPAVPSTQ